MGYRLTLRKKVFINKNSDINCARCLENTRDELVCSLPKRKYYCFKCAQKLHIIVKGDIPDEVLKNIH